MKNKSRVNRVFHVFKDNADNFKIAFEWTDYLWQDGVLAVIIFTTDSIVQQIHFEAIA